MMTRNAIMRITALIICVLVIPAQTAALEQDNVVEYIMRKVAELETKQQECNSYQSRMLLELSFVKNKLEQSERRISELEAIVYDMRSDENLSLTLEKDPVVKSTNKIVTQFITDETNVNRISGLKGMTSYRPGILKREGRATATKQIGFYATIVNEKGLQVHDNEIVHFDTVLHNEGNGFNKETGIFTCPLSGTYFFTASVMTSRGYHTAVHLIVNGQTKGNSYANGADSWDQGSISSIVHCEAGQNVWISVYGGTYIHGDYYTSSSGFLLWGDVTGSS